MKKTYIFPSNDLSFNLNYIGCKGAPLIYSNCESFIVGCFNVTLVLKTSNNVHVDGGRGIVEINERSK